MLYYNIYPFRKKSSFKVDFSLSQGDTVPSYDLNIKSVDCDDTGTKLICTLGDLIMLSTDGGTSWSSVLPSGSFQPFRCVAMDSDGTNMIVGGYGGRIYTSSDSGVTWTERQPAGDSDCNWLSVASDSDGSNLIACNYGGRLYTSSDSGVTWTERQPAGDSNLNWACVASDSDGSNLIAGVYGGRIYTSSDSGVNWTERRPDGDSNFNWKGVASDSDGSNLIVCANGGKTYISSDNGVTWTNADPTGSGSTVYWKSVASNNDGSKLIVLYSSGHGTSAFVSTDSGATWAQVYLSANDLYSVNMSSNGQHIFIGNKINLEKSINTGSSFSTIKPAKYAFVIYKDDVFSGCIENEVTQIIDDVYTIELSSNDTDTNKILIKNAVSATTTYNGLILYSNRLYRGIIPHILPFLRR